MLYIIILHSTDYTLYVIYYHITFYRLHFICYILSYYFLQITFYMLYIIILLSIDYTLHVIYYHTIQNMHITLSMLYTTKLTQVYSHYPCKKLLMKSFF